MHSKTIVSCSIFICFLSVTCVLSFDDPISLVGRMKWNYTNFEQNLWKNNVTNRNLTQIYVRHVPFFAFKFNENLFNFGNGIVDVNLPFIEDFYNATKCVNDIWTEYSNSSRWFLENRVKTEITSISDRTQSLELSMNRLQDDNYHRIYFEYFQYEASSCLPTNRRLNVTTYQLVEQFYTEIISAQLKCYILLQLAYLAQSAQNFEANRDKGNALRVSFQLNYASFADNTQDVVWSLSREVWNCDNKSVGAYTQLTNFIQGYVENKINMNAEFSCSNYCTDFNETKQYGCHNKTACGYNFLDRNKTMCTGTIRDCDYFDSSMIYCSNENDEIINRRVNFVKLDSGKVLGEEIFCPFKVHLKSWLSWLSKCNFCFCYCDAPGPRSDRHFNLREVVSNITENKVISAVYFTKKNGIIHLNGIERGLLPNAKINKTDTNIISNDNFTINDENIKINVDFYTMTYENRAMDLDTITGQRDQLLTGIRFHLSNGHLQLQARFTYFDEATGQLHPELESRWFSNDKKDRTLIKTDHLHIPTDAQRQSAQDSSPDGNYIRFGPTGWMQDMAQLTVPFFDATIVESNNDDAVSGAGIYYKSTPGYAGFIAPKLIMYDRGAAVMRIRAAVGVYGV